MGVNEVTHGTQLTLERCFQAHNDYLLRCVLSPDVKMVATTSADKTVKLWNTSSWVVEKTLEKHQRCAPLCLYIRL
jgi:G protein beta subunit-like protein